MKIYSEKNINEIKLSYEDNKMNTKQKNRIHPVFSRSYDFKTIF